MPIAAHGVGLCVSRDRSAVFGTRLSIIDLSPERAADGERGRYRVGHLQRRIYNHAEIRRELERWESTRGGPTIRHRDACCTRTRSGASPACNRFYGMFAFAI